MKAKLRVAVDSNVVFSAVRTGKSRLNGFWTLDGVDVLISRYVIDEVSRHLVQAEQRVRLWRLLDSSYLIADGDEVVLPASVALPEKDRPILQSAVAAGAQVLVTGDFNHFRALFGLSVQGVLVETTTDFMRRHANHFYPEEDKT